LKGCPELVDGAIAYAEGNKAFAIQKLQAARSLNTPAQLKQLAGALRTIGEASPTDAGRPLIEVAALLSTEQSTASAATLPNNPYSPPGAGASASPPSPPVATAVQRAPDRSDIAERLALYALTAREDPARRVGETVDIASAQGVPCEVGGSPAVCYRRKQGALMVTDVVASEDCGQRTFLSAADSDTPGFGFLWTLPARAQGVHGASFAVRGWQWLFIAVKSPAKPQVADRGCFVTWSAFQPRLVPTLTSQSFDPKRSQSARQVFADEPALGGMQRRRGD
jgi:hypothetical protein